MRRLVLFVCFALVAGSALAQPRIGSLPNNADGYYPDAPWTMVDLGHPATENGTATFGTVRWIGGTAATCTSAFKLKVLRPGNPPWGTYTTVAERGPYDSANGYLLLTFNPAIDFRRGDVLAITQLKGGLECGGVAFGNTYPAGTVVTFPSEIAASGTLNGVMYPAGALSVELASSRDLIESVITVAGSVAGANNSFFRTSLQLSNIGLVPIKGKLVFHRANASAAVADPSVPYSLGPRASVNFNDIVAAFGVSGLGTIDIIPERSAPPLATSRVFNDLGAAGSLGFSQAAIPVTEALQSFDFGYFQQPADLTNFRMNVGIRTLAAGAQIRVRQYAPDGTPLGDASIVKDYPPSYFEQVPLATFLGAAPTAGGIVRVSVASGSAIVYASSTDNRTNDTTATFLGLP